MAVISDCSIYLTSKTNWCHASGCFMSLPNLFTYSESKWWEICSLWMGIRKCDANKEYK